MPDVTSCDYTGPTDVTGGTSQTVSVDATVSNTESSAYEVTVEGVAGGVTFDSRTFTLGPGEQTIALSGGYTFPDADTTVSVGAEVVNQTQTGGTSGGATGGSTDDTSGGTTGGSTGGTSGGLTDDQTEEPGGTAGQFPNSGNVGALEVVSAGPPSPSTVYRDPDSSIKPSVDFPVEVRNTSDQEVFGGVQLYLDGDFESESQLQLAGGETNTFTLPRLVQNMPGNGTFNATIRVVSGGAGGQTVDAGTVTIKPANEAKDGTDEPIPGEPGDCPPGYHYNESAGKCWPDCPEGKAYFKSIGCADVSGDRPAARSSTTIADSTTDTTSDSTTDTTSGSTSDSTTDTTDTTSDSGGGLFSGISDTIDDQTGSLDDSLGDIQDTTEDQVDNIIGGSDDSTSDTTDSTSDTTDSTDYQLPDYEFGDGSSAYSDTTSDSTTDSDSGGSSGSIDDSVDDIQDSVDDTWGNLLSVESGSLYGGARRAVLYRGRRGGGGEVSVPREAVEGLDEQQKAAVREEIEREVRHNPNRRRSRRRAGTQ